MNTSNTYLRFFNEDDSYVVYVPVANLCDSGIPIDPDTGDDLDNDESIYFYQNGTYHEYC